jgi:hypothetical protein
VVVAGKLWQAYFDRFCSLAIIPSEEELRQLQMDLKVFLKRSARLNLKVQAEFLHSRLRSAVGTIRLQANMGSLAQYQSQEAANCAALASSLLASLPTGGQALHHMLHTLQGNLAGLTISAWGVECTFVLHG